MAVNISDFNKIWASTSPLAPYSFSDANYKQGWNFVGATPPARQMWDSYMKFSDEKQQYIVNNFLPLIGGTMTGAIKGAGTLIASSRNDYYVQINGGELTNDGAKIILFGKDEATRAGYFFIDANDGTNLKRFEGYPDGTLKWVGKPLHYGESFINATYKDGWTIDRITNTLQQWRRQTIDAGDSYTWTFAKPFDSQVYCFFLTAEYGNNALTVTSKSATAMTIRNDGSAQTLVNMMAIGISES